MSVKNLITRADAICSKYDKYDVDKHRESNNPLSDDAFVRLYAALEADLQHILQKVEDVVVETKRAAAVAMKAEIRRSKARLLDELPKLQRLAFKKVKGVSKEELEARNDLVTALKHRIEAISDGSSNASNQTSTLAASKQVTGLKFNPNLGGSFKSEFFQQTEESNKYRQEYEMRKIRQDEGLDVVAEGLHTLKNMARDMNEELDRQAPLMDEIDDKVDKATSDIRSTNLRLKDTVTKLRSSRNFCFDIILLCIILGIAMYLYNVLK